MGWKNNVSSSQANSGERLVERNTRLTKRQTTTRPDSHWKEGWDGMSKPARATAIAEWGKEKARRDEIRARHGLPEEVPPATVQQVKL